LGKPALIVEHHGYFRHGYEPLAAFVTRLSALDDRLEWSNLATICSQASLVRQAADGRMYVRFYTRRFRLTNHDTHIRHYTLLRSCIATDRPPVVMVNGIPHRHCRVGDDVQISLALQPGESADVGLLPPHPRLPDVPPRAAISQRLRVTARRILCEFRDNYVDTTDILSRSLAVLRHGRAPRHTPRSASPHRRD
jgi:hypothetical protein